MRSRSAASAGLATASRSRAQRNAARVFPEPVGATTSVSRPEEIASHAPSCAAVGAAKAPSNHARVTPENRPSEGELTGRYYPAPPTRIRRFADSGKPDGDLGRTPVHRRPAWI